MKIQCAISGIEFSCDHFPAVLNQRELTHPIFALPQKRLVSYAGKWTGQELTDIDNYLLFLALLNSTDLIEWRVPVVRTTLTSSIIANNMEDLFRVVSTLNMIKSPKFAVPRFAVTQDNKDLSNIFYFLESWDNAIADFKSGYKTQADWNSIANKELALERLIKSPMRLVESYAGILADWAELAASFPSYQSTTDTILGKLTLADYWKQIIKRCCKSESIFSIPRADLEELIEHCEHNLVHGTIYSAKLMSLLRDGLVRQKTFLGFTDDELVNPTKFVILDDNASVEDANKLAAINSAPAEKPVRTAYSSNFLYTRALLNYNYAQSYKQKLAEHLATTNSIDVSVVLDNNGKEL